MGNREWAKQRGKPTPCFLIRDLVSLLILSECDHCNAGEDGHWTCGKRQAEHAPLSAMRGVIGVSACNPPDFLSCRKSLVRGVLPC